MTVSGDARSCFVGDGVGIVDGPGPCASSEQRRDDIARRRAAMVGVGDGDQAGHAQFPRTTARARPAARDLPPLVPRPRPRTPSASSSLLGPLSPPIAHDHPSAHEAPLTQHHPHPVTHFVPLPQNTFHFHAGVHVQRNIATQPKRPPRRAGRRDKLPLHKARARRTQVPSLTARKPSPSPALYDGLKVLDPHQSSRGGRVIVEMLLRARHRSVSGELERRRPAALTCAFCVRELLRAIGALYCRGGTVQQSPVACGRPPGAVPGGRWDDGRGTSDAAD